MVVRVVVLRVVGVVCPVMGLVGPINCCDIDRTRVARLGRARALVKSRLMVLTRLQNRIAASGTLRGGRVLALMADVLRGRRCIMRRRRRSSLFGPRLITGGGAFGAVRG